jgi:hypothetical protein
MLVAEESDSGFAGTTVPRAQAVLLLSPRPLILDILAPWHFFSERVLLFSDLSHDILVMLQH